MGIATQPSQLTFAYLSPPPKTLGGTQAGPSSPASMSRGFHQGIFSFPDGFDRSANREQHQNHHVAQQSRRDKLRVQGFDAAGHPLVPIDEHEEEASIYGSTAVGAGSMLSDMFSFPAAGLTAVDLHANQISGGFHLPPRPAAMAGGFTGDWYGPTRQGNQQQHSVTALNADSAAAMQLFLMNPLLQPPPPQQQQHPNSPSPPPPAHQQAFQSFGDAPFGGRVAEGQGLSLSLSSSLQQLEMAKADELRVREGVLYFNNQQQQHSTLHLQGQVPGHGQQSHLGYGSMGVVNVLRNSKYAKPGQELLEEFCSVGKGQLKGSKAGRHRGGSSNPNCNPTSGGGSGGASSSAAASSSSKDVPPLASADRFEHQRKKAKLISMLDEACINRLLDAKTCSLQENAYGLTGTSICHSCILFDYIIVAAIQSLLRPDANGGELLRLRYGLRSRNAIHIARSEGYVAAFPMPQGCNRCTAEANMRTAGRKRERHRLRHHQGGDPEAPVARSDLAAATGLQSDGDDGAGGVEAAAWITGPLGAYPEGMAVRALPSPVSNWFINARVRLWKPMVEDMYLQESKEEGEERERSETELQRAQSPTQQQRQGQRTETNVPSESDASPSTSSVSRRHHRLASASENPPPGLVAAHQPNGGDDDSVLVGVDAYAALNAAHVGDMYRYGTAAGSRLGTAGDVSLTLGLRHAGGSTSEKSRFSLRNFGGC
ncbi:hypothetical protein BHE74_00008977 [Ensete ventricosum]|nr:hypothetical protein BHE74_00008977 [Ensete ventricosum]